MWPATITSPGFAPSSPSYCRRLPRVSKISCAYNDPFSTLGVPKNATDAEIKAAHRKRVKEFHPDIAASKNGVSAEAAHAHFISIQQAYELLTGKARGKEVDLDSRSSGWSFHDFYWSFKFRNRRKPEAAAGQPSASAFPHSPPPSSEALRYQWKSQLQGLKQKAEARKYHHQASQDNNEPSSSAGGGRGVASSRSREEEMVEEEEEEEPITPLEEEEEEEQSPVMLHDSPSSSSPPPKHHGNEPEESWSHIVSFFSETEPGVVAAAHSDVATGGNGDGSEDHATYVDTPHARKFADNGVVKERVMHQFIGLRRRAAMMMKEVARSVED